MNEIKITALGTVSPYPKGDMNCPGFLVSYDDQKILLDCGNGTTRYLSFPDDLKNLHVAITHYHDDHFGDIGSIQYGSYVNHNLGLLDDKVNIYLPKNDFRFCKKKITSNEEAYVNYFDIDNDFSFRVKDIEVSFLDNKSHTIESFMVKLENDDFKIIYTSDVGTTNFDSLVEFSLDADLIICESSFLKKHNSPSKTHLTAHDAGVLGLEANAKKLLLTHFWPEEDRKLYLEEAREVFPDTEILDEGKRLVLRK